MSEAVKIGYLLPTRERIMSGDHATRPILDLARHAEAIGFDSVWIGDSVTAKPRHEALAMLAAVAAVTTRVEIGPAVLLPMLRNPTLLAHQVATIDRISEGRLILGVGTARDNPAMRAEFEATGTPFEKRIGRMLEGLEVAKRLWSGEPVDWQGRWTLEQATVAPTPFRPGGPPIWGGGGVDNALKRAARYFDGWFPSGPSDAAIYAERLARLRGFAEEAGRDPDAITPAMYLTVALDANAGKADAALDAYLEGYYNQPAGRLRQQQAGFAGDPEAAAEWIAGFVAAGCRHICIRPVGESREQMERVMAMRERLLG